MPKIGTAVVEIKPVLNEQALAELADQIETTIRDAVARALGD